MIENEPHTIIDIDIIAVALSIYHIRGYALRASLIGNFKFGISKPILGS